MCRSLRESIEILDEIKIRFTPKKNPAYESVIRLDFVKGNDFIFAK
jgi:hypothetical protein